MDYPDGVRRKGRLVGAAPMRRRKVRVEIVDGITGGRKEGRS
jgi:hypothetical protein